MLISGIKVVLNNFKSVLTVLTILHIR